MDWEGRAKGNGPLPGSVAGATNRAMESVRYRVDSASFIGDAARGRLALWVLPLTFTALLFVMRGASLPFWQVFNLDPTYYYLLNGLRLIEGLAPTDMSHPGVPVQVFVALVLKAMHLGQSAEAIVDAVLADPERHLMAVTDYLYPLVGLSLLVLGRAVLGATGSLGAALLAQSTPFLSRLIPKMGIHPKPEPFLIIAVALLAALCFAIVRANKAEDRHAIGLGLVMGFGIACKIHFVALGLLPLLLLDRRRLILYGLASAAALLVFVAPALPSFDIWLGWMKRIVLGSGAYGGGAPTVIDPGRYPRAVLKLFGSKPILIATTAGALYCLGAYFRLRRRSLIPADPMARLLAGILLAQLATILLIAKQPAPHYMVPVLMLCGPALAGLWVMSKVWAAPLWHRRVWAALGLVLLVVQADAMRRQNAELAGWSQDTMAFDMGRFEACAKIHFDAASSPSFALHRGDMNAQGRYGAKLAALMPADDYSWSIFDHTWWNRGLRQWGQPLSLSEVLSAYPCAVFRGSQAHALPEAIGREIPGGVVFDDRCEVGEETLFISGGTCAQ